MAKIENEDDFKSWLEGKPHDFASLLAARAALRVLPPVGRWRPGRRPENIMRNNWILLSLRAAGIPLVGVKNSHSRAQIQLAAEFASRVGDGAATAATAAALAFAMKDPASAAGNSIKASATYAAEFSGNIWRSVEFDANKLETNQNGLQIVAELPLWAGGEADTKTGIPEIFSDDWKSLKDDLLRANEDWDVWLNWYGGLLAGTQIESKELELFYVLLDSEESWKKGPAFVNALIKTKIRSERHSFNDIFLPANLIDTLANLENRAIGGKFVKRGEHLGIDPSGDETDAIAASDPITRQLHDGVLRRAREFLPTAMRLNNQYGWSGLGPLIGRTVAAFDCVTDEIPARLGTVYEVVVEVATFLEQDNDLAGTNQSDVDTLDADSRRQLSSLVIAAAPWVRRFPTARLLDDEAGAFLARKDLFEPATGIVQAAADSKTLKPEDIETLRALLDAWERGEFQGGKAGARSFFTIRNLLSVSMSVYLGAVGSVVALSPLAKNIGGMLVYGEIAIESFMTNESIDVRLAITEIIKRAKVGDFPIRDETPIILPNRPRIKGS